VVSSNTIIKSINSLLNKVGGKYNLKRMRGMAGYMESTKQHYIIKLDPTKDILPSLIHECCHVLYPELSENRIGKMERKVVGHISMAQFKHLMIKLIKRL